MTILDWTIIKKYGFFRSQKPVDVRKGRHEKKQLEKCRLRHQATHRDTSSALVTVDSHPSRYLDEKVTVRYMIKQSVKSQTSFVFSEEYY